MQVLRRRYVERAATDRAALAVAVESEDWIEVRRIAHGNSGTGATFGFPDGRTRS
jgi:HPt (histidine-containing phosphotransfer) domain-containing protein